MQKQIEIYEHWKEKDYEQILMRRKKIENYKENSEYLKQEKLQQVQLEANKKEEKRRQQEMKRLEEENKKNELRRKQAEEALILIFKKEFSVLHFFTNKSPNIEIIKNFINIYFYRKRFKRKLSRNNLRR